MEYQAKGTNLDEEIKKKNKTDWLAIQQAKNLYLEAQAAGDTAGMEAAHASAEAVRSKYGYSGGEDGSEYLTLPQGGSGKSDYADLVKQIYQQAGAAAETKLEQETARQNAAIRQQEQQAEDQRQAGARQAAVLREQQRRDLAYDLSRLGLTGGAAETAALQLEQDYSDNLRRLDADYRETAGRLQEKLRETGREALEARAELYGQLAASLVPDYLTAVEYDRQTGLDLAQQRSNVYQQQLALAARLAEYGDFSIYEQLGADTAALKAYFARKNKA